MGGIAILGAIGFFLYRRRRSGGVATGVAQGAELQAADEKLPTYSIVPVRPQELPVDQYHVAELDSRAIDNSRY